MKTAYFVKRRAVPLLICVLSFSSYLSAEELGREELLGLSIQDLMNMEISVATKTAMSLQNVPSIVSVISGEEIRNMGARSVTDVLRTVPGFDIVLPTNSPQHRIYIRGMTSALSNEKVKLMIDGHSMQAFWGDPLFHLDRLPLAGIKKIEIIRGPGSALYGTGAFLGVINIITQEGGDSPSRISFEGGSFDTLKPYGEFSYKEGDFKSYLYADYYTTDGYDGEVGSDMADIVPIFAPSASRKMTDENSHYTVRTSIAYNDLYFSAFLQKIENEIPIGALEVLTDEDSNESRYAYAEAGYKLSFADSGHLLMKAYYDYSEEKNVYEAFPEETGALYGFPEGKGLHGGPSDKHGVAGGEISGDYEVFPGIQAVAGISYDHERQYDVATYANYNQSGNFLEVGGITYPPFPYQYFPGGVEDISENANWGKTANRNVTALYGQATFDIRKLFSVEKAGENLSATLGWRYDHYDDIGSSLNPRFGIVYAPTEKLRFKVLYGTAFRAPSFVELYSQNTPMIGNENLKPEEISTAEVLAGYDFTDAVRGSITFFDVRSKNLIQYSRSDTGFYEYGNIGEMRSYGAEAELKAVFGNNKYAYLNITWQDVKNTANAEIQGTDRRQEDFHPGMVPEFYGNIGLTWGLTENLIADTHLNYVGKRERSEEKILIGEDLVRKDQREPVPERWLLNASLTFRDVFTKGLELQVSGFNLLDQDHRDPAPDNNIADDVPRPGVTFRSRISYSF